MRPWRHKIEKEKWEAFSKREQILNIAAELCRIYQGELRQELKKAGAAGVGKKAENVLNSYERCLELIDLTIEDPKWRGRYELYQLRDAVSSCYLGKTDPAIANFFYTWLMNLSGNL